MRRGAEQRIRKFLANTFKNDGPSAITKSAGDMLSGTSSYIISFNGIDGPLAGECCGLNISFYNTAARVFVGKSYRTEIGDTPAAFHAPVDSTVMVVESIRVDQETGDEVVSCWWYTPLEGLLKLTSLKLQKGCGQQMYLETSVWPLPTLGATLFLEVKAPADTTVLPSLIPPALCVPEDYTDLCADEASKPFRVIASKLSISEQMVPGVTSLLEEAGLWSALLFAHNSHMLLTPVAEVSLSIDAEGSLVTSKDINLSALPAHNATNLVCCLRFKRSQEARFRAVGFTCFDLLTGVPKFCDMDANLSQLPFLKGPFSCEDPRCLSLEHEQPYAMVPLTMSVRLAYHNTPTPAPIWSEEIQEAKPVVTTASITGLPADAEPSRDGKRAKSGKKSKSPSESPTVPPLSPTDGTDKPFGGATAATTTSTTDIDLYKLLCEIMAEVKEIKRTQDLNLTSQQQFTQKGPDNISGSTRPPTDHFDPSNPEMSLAAMTSAYVPTEVRELQPRRVTIPRRRQAAISEGMKPFYNPQTHERLLDTTTIALPGDLPFDQLIIRFEGVTFGHHGAPMPSSVAIATSYSALPPQLIGPILTRVVAKEDSEYGPSFQFTASDRSSGTGFLWFEPVESATNPALQEIKGTANMYLHLFDASTMFYVASAIFKPSKLRRSANSLMATTGLDLVLYEDLSMAERDVPDKVPLIASTDVGYLHMTAALLGVPSHRKKEKDENGTGENGSENSHAPSGNHGKVVFVKKLPADFGDECRPTNDLAQLSELKPVGFEGLTDQRANLHRLRANFVRNLLQDRDTNALAVHMNGGRIPTDNEHKLRYVEKRRDEVKSTKIAEALRARVTSKHQVTAWLGAPRVISTAFANPFPMQNTFHVEVPATSPAVSLHPDTNSIITLGPHESTNIKTVIRISDPSADLIPFHTQVIVRTMHKEVSRIIDFDVTTTLPVINRRYEIFGSSGETVVKRIHGRAFPTSPNVAALGAMCHFCGVIGPRCSAETRAVVEPLTPAMVAAWEEVVVTATIPAEGSAKAFVILYKDAEMTAGWETWEITMTAVQRFETREIFYGQTTTVALPVICERASASDPNVTAVAQRDCVVLKVRPAKEGVSTFQVQTVKGPNATERLIVSVPCVLPRPTFEDFVDLTFAQSGAPVYRLLTFANKEPRQKVFRVRTNYQSNIKVIPEQFALAPQEMKQLRIEITGLNFLGTEGRWPMWIFVNDVEDMTVDSYRITVTVREGNPAIMPVN